MRRKEDIKLSTFDVAQRIFSYTHYVGESRRNSGFDIKLAASIQASPDDYIQLSDQINIAISELVKITNTVFGTCKASNVPDSEHEGYSIITFTLAPPQYFPMHLLGELRNTMINYMVMRTLQQWMLQQKPDEAAIITSESEKIAVQLRELMNCRMKPRKAHKASKTNIKI